jgi:antitoxin CptB
MDLLLGAFCDERVADLSEAELDDFEVLLEVPDADLYARIVGPDAAPAQSPIIAELRRFHDRRRG